ncbi:MAG: hypothetical protein KBB95_21345, partial [Deltaproteobacteria bacterium]|nr:hypothetical protein [Deltaproteobacteria bacterium]
MGVHDGRHQQPGRGRGWQGRGGTRKSNAAQRSADFQGVPTGRASASVPAATPAPPRRIDPATITPTLSKRRQSSYDPRMRCVIVMDPVSTVLVNEDTTFALMLELEARGHRVDHCL